MQKNNFLVLVINLDRAPQRLMKISNQLDRLGIKWERLSAADGKNLNMSDRSLLDEQEFGRRHGKTPLPGELGCYLSHVWAFERFLQTDFPFAVILEDDVLLSDELPRVLEALVHAADDWDMVKLSGVHSGTPLKIRPLTESHHLAIMLSRLTGSSAYMLNRRAAQVYRQGLLPMRIPYDHEFDRAWAWGLTIRMVTPCPCGHDGQEVSMISAPQMPSRKFHWTRRWPAYRWRLGNEIKRLTHGLTQWAKARLG